MWDFGLRKGGGQQNRYPAGLIWKNSSSAAFESGLSGVSGMIGDVGKVAGIKVMKPAHLYIKTQEKRILGSGTGD